MNANRERRSGPRLNALRVLRAVGGFGLAQWLTRRRLRILAYHGFAEGDEYTFDPFTFMRPDTFAGRLEALRRRGVPVISLEEAVARLQSGRIARAETVITLDDGWLTNLTVAAPLLQRYGFPVTVYVTSEHLSGDSDEPVFVFDVAASYMLWRSDRPTLQLVDLHREVDGEYPLGGEWRQSARRLLSAIEMHIPRAAQRHALAHIAAALGQDIDTVLSGDRFRLATRNELRRFADAGMDLQLHSHRHRLPGENLERFRPAIEENRRAIEGIVGRPAVHFCYPSGYHTPNHPAWLAELGIVSATTCEPGHNARGTNPLVLCRSLIAMTMMISSSRRRLRVSPNSCGC